MKNWWIFPYLNWTQIQEKQLNSGAIKKLCQPQVKVQLRTFSKIICFHTDIFLLFSVPDLHICITPAQKQKQNTTKKPRNVVWK